jgi:SAM-dependent methyltransferase
MTEIWSNTDYPYMCLKDEVRTLAFRDAMRAVVRSGDVVVDVGAGSGILSFFAAEAGAGKVYAVEIDPVSAAALRRSVELNPALADRISVVEGDAAIVELPQRADVVVAEIIETGLLDEQQVPVLNALRRRGVIADSTRLVPASYETTLQLVAADHRYYGFVIAAPKHEWPFYTGPGWYPTSVKAASDVITVTRVDFAAGIVDEDVAGEIELELDPDAHVNAVRLAGRIGLSPDQSFGPSHAVNGDKILPISEFSGVARATLRWRYRMGAGLGGLELGYHGLTRVRGRAARRVRPLARQP